MKKSPLILNLLFTFVLFILPKWCSAQQVAISLQPSVNEIVAKPGRTIYQELTFVNSGDPQVYTFRLYQLEVNDKFGNYRIKSSPEQLPLSILITAPYIRLDKPFLIQSQKQETLPLRIDIPTETPEGEYLFSLVAESEKPLSVEGTINTRISAGTGAIFFIRVLNDNIDEKKTDISLFNAVTQVSLPFGKSRFALVDSHRPIPFVLMLKNKGRHTVVPHGEITLKNLLNKNTVNVALLPVYAYPEKDRLIPAAAFQQDDCLKKYGVSFCSPEYSYVHPGYTFGFIEATAKIEYGESNIISYGRDFFIVLPFWMLWFLGILAGVSLLVLGYVWKKHWHRKATKKSPSVHKILP